MLVPVDDVSAMAAGMAEAGQHGNQRVDPGLFREKYSAEGRCRDYEQTMIS
jgi:hypothetical protein